MISRTVRKLPAALVFVVLAMTAPTVMAQGNTFNPYGNSGYADYREFGNPMVSNNPALPGQAVLNNRPTISPRRANSFQQYSDGLDNWEAEASTNPRAVSSSLPYYQAYQRLNSQYNRVYQPNDTPEDRKFRERQKQKDESYAKALVEKDPTKRAKLLRELEKDPADRSYSTSRSFSAARGATSSKPGTNGVTSSARTASPAAAAGRPSASVERRTTPPPVATGARSRATDAGRAPAPPSGRPATTDAPTSTPRAVTRPAPDPSTIATPTPALRQQSRIEIEGV